MKLIEFKKDDNNNFSKKQLNKKKVIISSTIFIIVIILVIIFSMYIANQRFRELMDLYVLRKSVTENSLQSVQISSEDNAYIYAYDKSLLILEKNTLTKYNTAGKKEQELKIEISNPIFNSDGKYLVIAEKDKQKIYLIHNSNILWEKNIEGNISRVNINKNGYTSVVISGTAYKSVIVVFDKNGKELFKTYLSNNLVTASSISEDNKFLSFAEINTSGTLIQSTIKTISIDKAIESPENSIINTYEAEQNDLILNIQYKDKNKLACMYNNSISIMQNGKSEILVPLDEKNTKITFSDIELNNYVYRIIEKSAGLLKTNSTVEIYNVYSKKQNIYNFNGVAKKVYSSQGVIALDLGSEIHFIGTNGWLIKKYIANQEIKNIVVTEGLAGIVYRDKVEFVEL